MKLENISMKDLLALHNKIADKPAGPKTFSTRDKLVARIQTIIVDKNVDTTMLWCVSAPPVTEDSRSSNATTAEIPDTPEPAQPKRGRGVGVLARQLLLDPNGYPHKLIAAMVNAQLDGAQAPDKSVRWYANDMRKKGITIPARQKPTLHEATEDQRSDESHASGQVCIGQN